MKTSLLVTVMSAALFGFVKIIFAQEEVRSFNVGAFHAEQFRKVQLYFSDGVVKTFDNSDHAINQAVIVQAIIAENDVQLREGARILLFEELTLNRMIVEHVDGYGNLNSAATILADKKTGKISFFPRDMDVDDRPVR